MSIICRFINYRQWDRYRIDVEFESCKCFRRKWYQSSLCRPDLSTTYSTNQSTARRTEKSGVPVIWNNVCIVSLDIVCHVGTSQKINVLLIHFMSAKTVYRFREGSSVHLPPQRKATNVAWKHYVFLVREIIF